jgi:hypothetical protein
MNPCPSPSPKIGNMPIRVTALAFDLCVLYYRSPCILQFGSLSSKNTGQEGDCKSKTVELVSDLHKLETVPFFRLFTQEGDIEYTA